MSAGNSQHAPGLPRNQSLQRAVTLLFAIAERPGGTTAAELSRLTGLPAPTTGRLLATLADLGLADRRGDGTHWVLGYELARLARLADPFAAFVDRAQPLIAELALRTGESATISHARAPDTIAVIAQADAPMLVGTLNWLGRSFSFHGSAAGKLALAMSLDDDAVARFAAGGLERYTPRTIVDPAAFVAEIQRVRRRGYGTTVDELEEGFTAVVVPIAEVSGGVALTLGLSGPTGRMDARRRRELLPLLRDVASRIRPLL